MSIAQQIATPAVSRNARRSGSPLQPVPEPRRVLAMVRILGLMTLTALGAALLVGSVAIALILVASSLGG